MDAKMTSRSSASVSLARPPVAIQAGALAHLRYIRDTMEAAHAFTSVPGKGCVAMGIVGLAAAVLSSWPALAAHWFGIWLGAAVAAVVLVAFFLIGKAKAQGFTLWRSVARRFFLVLAPALLVGAVLTTALAATAARDLIPGVWLLLYGAGLAAAGVFSLPVVSVTGCAFMLLGGVALAAPAQWAMALLALGFGGLHIVLGFIVWRRHGG
jgi:hypothetical protein